MSTFVDVNGVVHDIPGIVIQAEVPDAQLVAEAIAARELAETTEEEASPSRWREADSYAELARRGRSTRWIADECGTNKDTVSRFVRCVERIPRDTERPTFWHIYREVKGSAEPANSSQVSNNSGDVEWFTPAEYIEAARSVMGGIDLDPASTPEANQVVGAESIWTKADNGLVKPWAGRVWMNPPYAADVIRPFCERLAESYPHAVTEACALVNSATETAWFHTLAAAASGICFHKRRIQFWHPDKGGAAGPLQGQAIFYLGPNMSRFREEFARFGFIATL